MDPRLREDDKKMTFYETIKYDGLVKTLNLHRTVIPAQAGIQ